MVNPKALKNADSSVEFEEEADTPSEVFVGEIYTRQDSVKNIIETKNEKDSKDDSEESESSEEDDEKGSVSSDESSKFSRCLSSCKHFSSRCFRFCRVDSLDSELFRKMLVPLTSMVVTTIVVVILSVFEDKIHQNLKPVVEMEEKHRVSERYPLI